VMIKGTLIGLIGSSGELLERKSCLCITTYLPGCFSHAEELGGVKGGAEIGKTFKSKECTCKAMTLDEGVF